MRGHNSRITFLNVVKHLALDQAVKLIPSLLPTGRREGNEYVALNPKRDDRKLGSFKINLLTGKWSDFAVGVGGNDLISLYAYLHDYPTKLHAARDLYILLGGN